VGSAAGSAACVCFTLKSLHFKSFAKQHSVVRQDCASYALAQAVILQSFVQSEALFQLPSAKASLK
jgi:hypothetical protein